MPGVKPTFHRNLTFKFNAGGILNPIEEELLGYTWDTQEQLVGDPD